MLAREATKEPLDLRVQQDRLDLQERMVRQDHKVQQDLWAQPAKKALQEWLDSLELLATWVLLVLEELQDLPEALGLVERLGRLDH